jgi:hypothetical protein
MTTLLIEILNVCFAVIIDFGVPGAGIYWVSVAVGLVIIRPTRPAFAASEM